MANPLVVGITGGSAAGKTTFARALVEAMPDVRCTILNQDRYFRDWSDYPPDQREGVRTANHPRAVLWERLVEHVGTLAAGGAIEEPVSGTRARSQGLTVERHQAGDLVVVEGHLILGCEPLRDLLNLKIYLDVDPHERVLRRLLRDTSGERGGNLETAVAWYRRDVLPNFPVHTEPSRRHADLVVPFDRGNEVAIQLLAAGLRDMLGVQNTGEK
ncbi:MAG: AAA family ATPase [Candidatus Latescibacteria bacterium]|nr:AAA family ATPase [Candidatus Latescibacterota bacterium]